MANVSEKGADSRGYGTVKEDFPIVKTAYGRVVGENREGIAVFRGIPYGGRVDRERRFQAPQEPGAWEGVLDCTKNGPICVQMAGSTSDFYGTGGHPEKLGLRYETQDENCLNLNILTPGTDKKRRPVLFYIHGGGYSILSGTILTGADALAREQDIVLVSVNHRLHAFGYLYLGDLDERFRDSGASGHLDLILALKWVRNNIEAFGGDPDCVTIMGESGGSDKVQSLLHMPEAQGLFHRAISISSFLPVGRLSREVATGYTLYILKHLGISPDHLDPLLEMPAREMTRRIYDPKAHVFSITFGPVSDGIHMGSGIGAGYVPALEGNTVPVIAGSSEDEMANFKVEQCFDVTWENLREKLLERGEGFGLPFTEKNVDDVIAAFRNHNDKQDSASHLFMKILSVKCHMGAATYFAEDFAREHKGPVYLYLNRYDAPNSAYPARRFAGHCMELAPSFRMVAYPHMEEYSRQIAELFCAFMRTGDPSTASLRWPAFEMERKETMLFDRTFEVRSDPLGEELEALDRVTGKREPVDPWFGEHYHWPIGDKIWG